MHYFRRLRKTEKKQEDDNYAQKTHVSFFVSLTVDNKLGFVDFSIDYL